MVHGVYVVVEDGGPQVEEGGAPLVEVGGAPLVEVEGGGPRGLHVVEGGGEPLVVGGEDGGGEVVILASLKCFFSWWKVFEVFVSCGGSLERNLYKSQWNENVYIWIFFYMASICSTFTC